MQESKSQGGMH